MATLTIGTTVDAVSAVVYGEDGPSGGIATDQDMGGGAHADHRAVMTGLRPEITHRYRLQGVAVDGNLYRSVGTPTNWVQLSPVRHFVMQTRLQPVEPGTERQRRAS